jgi:putative phosphoribosyl transferase
MAVAAGAIRLPELLAMPIGATGVVVFAHGSDSSRYSSRNRHAASVLNQAGLGTLLFDLLSADEELDRAMCSTSGCWLTACRPPPAGWRPSLPPRARRSATSAPAPAGPAAEPAADIAALV